MRDSHRLFIGGKWQDAGGTFDVMNPATGSMYCEAADAGANEARAACEAAGDASSDWAAMPHSQRARLLLKVADVIEKRQQDIAQALVAESGSWIGKAMFEAGYVPGVFRAAAAAAYQVTGETLPSEYGKVSMVVRRPLGVVGVISPWNFPLTLSSRGIAIPLAVGNAVVLKPSEETPYSGGLFLAECFEEAGAPEGVLNVVTCSRDNVADVGDAIIGHAEVKAISFTGSTAVGREIASRAGSQLKKACMELGGKDALIVLDDADMALAVNAATFGTFMHQGQICMSVERIIVHEKIAEAFIERFVRNTKKLGVGDPSKMENVIGPIINQKQLDNIHRQVEDAREKGAEILTGGSFDKLYYQPTVVRGVTREMSIFRDETFGPVAAILTAKDEDEAVEIANDSEYGLSAGVITRDEERGMRVALKLDTGMAHINDSSVNDEPHVPFGGVKNSGLGRHGGRQAIDTFTETRWVTLERGGRHYPPPFVEQDD